MVTLQNQRTVEHSGQLRRLGPDYYRHQHHCASQPALINTFIVITSLLKQTVTQDRGY